ncbi:MAG: proprotein convertase P-domain-containing protein [Chitinophagales bacterium]
MLININYSFIFYFVIFFNIIEIVHGQRYDSLEKNKDIPDYINGLDTNPLVIHIPVKSLAKEYNKAYGLERVQLAIKHPYISDIKVVLINPAGTEVWLTNRNGNDGADYIETIFNDTGFKGPIREGNPPFLGEYLPDGYLAHLNDTDSLEGTWILKVYDLKENDVGKFNSVSLFFSNNPSKNIEIKCSEENPEYCRCKNGKKRGLLLPDLTIIPNFTINNFREISPSEGKNGMIKFGVAIANIGDGPLELVSTGHWYCGDEEVGANTLCPDGHPIKLEMWQNYYCLKNNELIKRSEPSSLIYYDNRPGHEHFHADDFVVYKLLKAVEGEKDVTQWELVNEGIKASFCIWNLNYCRGDFPNVWDTEGKQYLPEDLVNYGFGGKYNGCNADYQGLSVGGIDSYGMNYEGQSIELPEGTPNGAYYLYLEVDLNNKYKELCKNNNSILIPIQLEKQ